MPWHSWENIFPLGLALQSPLNNTSIIRNRCHYVLPLWFPSPPIFYSILTWNTYSEEVLSKRMLLEGDMHYLDLFCYINSRVFISYEPPTMRKLGILKAQPLSKSFNGENVIKMWKYDMQKKTPESYPAVHFNWRSCINTIGNHLYPQEEK